MIFFFFS